MISREEWTGHQHFELNWWTENSDTFGEEYKQTHVYAPRMGLGGVQDGGRWPIYNMHGLDILDVGGGPVSLLLKTRGAGMMHVVDPCDYPSWTRMRYEDSGIVVYKQPAEDFKVAPTRTYDEAWCYNVLQHTIDPEKVVAMMRRKARLIRIFEWIDMPPHEGHPHELNAHDLDRWLGDSTDGWHNTEDIMHPATITDAKPWFIGKAFFGYRAT